MATYLDFLRITRRGDLRRAYWICGAEEVLREQVVVALQRIAKGKAIASENVRSVHVQEDGERAVWAALNTWPLDPSQEAFLSVRGAERLRSLTQLSAWLSDRQAPRRLAVFVADEPRWPTDRDPEVRAKVSARGMYVECGSASEKAALAAGMAWLKTNDETFTRKVLDLNGWRLETVRDVARKAQVLGALNNYRVIEYLSEPDPAQSFVDELTACNRVKAIQSAVSMEIHERSPAIGLIDHNLEVLSRINAQLSRCRSQRELASRLNIHRVIVEKLYPYARLYDADAVKRRSVELAKADRAVVTGATVGVMEVLASRW